MREEISNFTYSLSEADEDDIINQSAFRSKQLVHSITVSRL